MIVLMDWATNDPRQVAERQELREKFIQIPFWAKVKASNATPKPTPKGQK